MKEKKISSGFTWGLESQSMCSEWEMGGTVHFGSVLGVGDSAGYLVGMDIV